MLSPKKVKQRKVFKGRMKGVALRGSSISFGEYALKALDCGKMTAQQIEAVVLPSTEKLSVAARSGSAYSPTSRSPKSRLRLVWER